jgi:acyl dehydratase
MLAWMGYRRPFHREALERGRCARVAGWPDTFRGVDEPRAASDLTPFTVRAVNAPQHARNPIHTDEGARAAGYPSALVAGVTTYAYLTHPLAAGWGMTWVSGGGAEVRFRSPVFADDELVCTPRVDADGSVAVAATVAGDHQVRAEVVAVRAAPGASPLRSGELLDVVQVELDGEWGDRYGAHVGDPLDLYTREGVVHPAVWPALANHVVHAQVAEGPWVHVRSAIAHHAAVPVGSVAEVRSAVIRRFERSGERAVLDVRVEVDGVPVASIEHEAIVALPAP